MSRYTSYVINFSDENHRSEIDLSPYVISDFAEHMMGAIARDHVVNNRPSRRSVTRQEPIKSRVPTYKCESDIGECTICQAQMKKGQMVCRLPCNNDVSHAFHKECIEPWLQSNNSCPNCRSEF